MRPESHLQNAGLRSAQRRAAYAVVCRAHRHSRSYKDMRSPPLHRAVRWRPLTLRHDTASLLLLSMTFHPSGASHQLASQLRRTRNGNLSPILARIPRHRRSFLPRTIQLWRSFLRFIRDCCPSDPNDKRTICRRATQHLCTYSLSCTTFLYIFDVPACVLVHIHEPLQQSSK